MAQAHDRAGRSDRRAGRPRRWVVSWFCPEPRRYVADAACDVVGGHEPLLHHQRRNADRPFVEIAQPSVLLGLHVLDGAAHLVSFRQVAVVAQEVHQRGYEVPPWFGLMLGAVDRPRRLAAEIVRTCTGKIRTGGHLDNLLRIASMRAATSSRRSAPFSYMRFASACAVRSKYARRL